MADYKKGKEKDHDQQAENEPKEKDLDQEEKKPDDEQKPAHGLNESEEEPKK